MTHPQKLREFKRRINRIAVLNGDDFRIHKNWDFHNYYIEVIETADGHVFLEGSGETPEKCIDDAISRIPDSLIAWGYMEERE